MSGEYGGCDRISQPTSAIFWQVPKAACGLALSWCVIVSYPSYWTLPASFFGPLSLNYPVADNTSPNWAFRSVLKAHNVLVLECPTIHNILLFRVKFGLEVEGLGFPGSQYALFLTMLLDVIHFSSPVIIRFKKGSILFRASRDVHTTTRSSNFSDLIHVAILNTSTPILSSEYGQKWFVELN